MGCRNIMLLSCLTALLTSGCAGKPDQPAAAPPGSEYENAAASYRQAFKAIDGLLEEPGTPLNAMGPVRPEEGSSDLVSRLEPGLEWMHDGAAETRCEWGVDLHRRGAAAEFPHIRYVRPLARGAALRASSRWDSGARGQAIEDVRAMLAFARHVAAGGKGGLVSLTASQDVEAIVIDLLRRWIADGESAGLLEDLCREPERPPGNLAKVALLLETETILPWARRLSTEAALDAQDQRDRDAYIAPLMQRFGREKLLELIAASAEHYRETADLLDLPPEEFAVRFSQCIRRWDGAGNPFSQVGIVECPGIPKGYWGQARLRAQWAMLHAASYIQRGGPQAGREVIDPFSDRPFDCELSRDGFILRSALIVDGERVQMEFKDDRMR